MDKGHLEAWEIENLRRSVAMLLPGHSAGALTRDAALALFEELEQQGRETQRYRELVAEIRKLVEGDS